MVPYRHQRQVPNILQIIHVATLMRAHTQTHTNTRTHTHIIVYAIVAGIDITQYASNKVCYYDVHTLYIIHSTSSRVNSVISQYYWWILSDECSKWLAPSFSKSTFTLDLECIAICLMLMSIGVFSQSNYGNGLRLIAPDCNFVPTESDHNL